MRLRSLAIAALCLFSLLSTEAFASTASTRIKRVYYTAAPGEVNNLTLSLVGTYYTLVDPGATIGAQPACTLFSSAAICPVTGIIGFTVSAGDGADSVTNATSTPSTLSGGDGNDSLAGGSGNDILRGNKGVDTQAGGPGDDFIDVRGDRGDIVTCGDGNDTVLGDAADSIAADCETVDRGIVPPPAARPGSAPHGGRPARSHTRRAASTRVRARPTCSGTSGRRSACRHGARRQPVRPAGQRHPQGIARR